MSDLADESIGFSFSDSMIVLSKPLAIVCGCTDWFVSGLVRNPGDRFSRDKVC